MAKEKNFENRVKSFLKENNIWFVKFFGCAFTKSGVPDLLICNNGRFIAIELKSEDGVPSELQLYNIRKIQECGGIAYILYPDNFETFKEAMIKIKNRRA